jgi:hypothetical protein
MLHPAVRRDQVPLHRKIRRTIQCHRARRARYRNDKSARAKKGAPCQRARPRSVTRGERLTGGVSLRDRQLHRGIVQRSGANVWEHRPRPDAHCRTTGGVEISTIPLTLRRWCSIHYIAASNLAEVKRRRGSTRRGRVYSPRRGFTSTPVGFSLPRRLPQQRIGHPAGGTLHKQSSRFQPSHQPPTNVSAANGTGHTEPL